MLDIIRYVLFGLLLISTITAGISSVRSRRSRDLQQRGILQAISNIWMGIMLIVLACIQMFMFQGSTVAVIIEALFLVLGAFHVFSGIRNRSYYANQKSEKSPA